MSDQLTRLLLVIVILVLGIQIGAAVYEMIVITPIWADNPPASVRGWNGVPELSIQPFNYKFPAAVALFSTSLLLFAASFGKSGVRSWVLLSGVLCIGLVAATVFYSFPLLQTMISERGGSLSDAEIVVQVSEWRAFSRLRLLVLCTAWGCTVWGLMQLATSGRRLFDANIRLR